MTWHTSAFPSAVTLQVRKPRAARWGLCALLIVALTACGTSGKNATITITSPEKGAILTSKDDADKDKPGLQYTVTAASTDVAPGTDVILRIEGERDAPLSEVNRDGSIEFKNVTLPRGKRMLRVTTGNGGIASPDDWDYTHKALVIDNPMDGRVISSASDDKDPETEGVQINVTVKTFAIDMDEDVVLQVDKEPVGTPRRPNGSATLNFTGVTLSNGEHTLVAVAGEVESDPVRISVNANCANITFVQPMVPSDGSPVVLGGGDLCPEANEQFRTTFAVSTDAGDGRNVDLYVNGTLAGNARVEGTIVTFEDVVLDRYNTPNEVEVVVETAQNVKCEPFKYPVPINLDCEGVDCSISAPKPVAGDDGSGKRVHYLNSSHKRGDGFDFEVHTDAAAIGRPVRLFIDGRETDAPEADPEGSDPDVKALFEGIALEDGEHTIVARCEHESGSFGLSRTATWIVDTKACEVDIQSPSADMLLVPGFDQDSNLSGVQIEIEADIQGDDCRRARTVPCDPEDGIAEDVGYEDFDGQSPLRTLVTLANEAEQNLCLDVLDRAGNKGSDHVPVRYTPTAPKLLIETPADGDRYNAQGGNGYQKDTDATSPSVCNAHFDVACSELGSTVRLHRDDANGTVFGMATCEARGDGDRALPGGYAGRARIRNAAFLSGNNDTVTVVATQSSGSGSQVGESPAITLKGDCQVPELAFTGQSPCEVDQIGVEGESSTVTRTIVVEEATLDTQNARLTVTSGGDVSYMSDASVSGGSFTFSNAQLGGPGTGKRDITITVSAEDEFKNVGTLTCNTSIVFDLPVLMVATPGEDAFFQTVPARSAELCTPTSGGEGVQIVATADVATNRTAAVSVRGGADIPLALAGTDITGCIPIEPGPNELVFKLTSTRTTATARVTRNIHLITAVPDTGVMMGTVSSPADRTGRVTFRWTLPPEAFAGQFVGYQLRCGTSPYDPGAGAAWLAASRNVPLPEDLRPPASEVELEMRVGEQAHCLIQAVDAAGQLTPPIESVSASVPFRQARFTGSVADTAMGRSFQNVGDVNGDGVEDLLVGGLGRAYLIFGNRDGWSSPTPNVIFNAGVANQSYLGESVARLGDFNGDGRPDFAIGEWFKASATPNNAGRVYVFYGRASGDAWPATVDLSSASTCGADICFTAETEQSIFGFAVSSAGDFDGDGRVDLAVGAQRHPVGGDSAGRLYVLLGSDSYTPGARGGAFYGVTVPVESGAARRGFAFDGPDSSRFGTAVVSVGAFDSTPGADLVVSAQGLSTGMPPGALYFVSGRSYTGPEIEVFDSSELGFRDGSEVPSGQPFDSGATLLGVGVYALGDAYRPEGSTEAKVDIGVYVFGDTEFVLYPGEANFEPSERVRVSAASGGTSYFGSSVCTGADLDGDGLTELCAAGERTIGTGDPPGSAHLWYADNFALQLNDSASPAYVLTDAASALNADIGGTVEASPTFVRSGARVVNFVGDLNGDGRLDMAVATPSVNDSAGEITILY